VEDALRQMDAKALVKLAREHPDLKDDPGVKMWVDILTTGITTTLKGRERSIVEPWNEGYVAGLRKCIQLRLDGVVVVAKTAV
jgi:hypothetical protein